MDDQWKTAYDALVEWLERERTSARRKARSDNLYAAERDKYRWLLQYMDEAVQVAGELRPPTGGGGDGDPFLAL